MTARMTLSCDGHREQWRTLPGHEGRYEVSNLGRVRSLWKAGKVLVPHLRQGYPCVRLNEDGKYRRRSVHSLVLLAFVGSRPNGLLIRHLDGDSTRSVLSNLAYGTSSENELDKVQHGTHPKASRIRCPRGHSLTDPKNLLTHKPGHRECRTCNRERAQERRLALAADAEASAAYRAKRAAQERARYARMRAARQVAS